MAYAWRGQRSWEFQAKSPACKHFQPQLHGVISVFKAGDTTANLHTALEMFQDHVRLKECRLSMKKEVNFILAYHLRMNCTVRGSSSLVTTSTFAGCMGSVVLAVCHMNKNKMHK